MNSLGVIGGLGPMATAYLLELITDMTDARTDQEHLDAIIFNRPSVPDRTAYILDHTKPSPVPPMIDIAQKLEALGVCALATPCVTAHSFHDELQSSVHIPFIHMVRETAAYLKEAGCKKPGIMATTGTVHMGLFQTALTELSIIKRDNELGPGYLDALEVLARACILACGKKLKPKYSSLIQQ